MRSVERFPERPALVVGGKSFSYWQLRESALRVAATLQAHLEDSWTPLTAVLGYRSATAFSGVLGALLAGTGYVPLNPTFPIPRTRQMLQRSGARSIIVDPGSLPQLNALLEGQQEPLLIIIPDPQDLRCYREQWPHHIFVNLENLEGSAAWREPATKKDAIAYLLFTSGSTGIPKGVMVAHRNVTSFVDHITDRLQFTERDIVSQMFDLTFDLSVFDMFATWERGACLCCPAKKLLINPAQFIRDWGLTVWFSVPSTIAFMKQLGTLKPDRFRSLRMSLFCGEPLPVSLAQAWMAAAPNSTLENLYGPTELTIACTSYRWHAERSPGEAELGIVPIGYPHPGMSILVIDDNLREVDPGQEGELLMNGPQMSLGYWGDRERTNSAFVVPNGRKEVFYRTGDRVRRPMGDAPLTYLGRLDFQIKIFGHRVELAEVEAVIREASGMDGVLAVGWPPTASGYGGIEAFIEGTGVDIQRMRGAAASQLPDYMVPRRFHIMGRLPRGVNDKLDRKAILQMLGDGL
jgi:amino acid adenylation domain-containing protein